MSRNTKRSSEPWIDPDDADVVWTEEMFRAAAIYRGETLIRPATGKLGPEGIIPVEPGDRGAGRPRSPNPKKQVTLRLDPDVLDAFRSTGKGWQSRINAALREKLGI
ncbi:BrnA antitoxin family protein [Erythrobacter sp. T5W1-R]|uniref:BrnA antitoxin family protein n=1 Tax=Erythrobacter sp. T5W1-R TaxID=3101752 RepID=UPI002AFE5B46|nr:BrnA antitoxin family protein [Erythrobacter sp. T5W1-R]MEA1617787.1 BrnA antitoxin family protein [Erythrobacter sp. T5W1-R]